MRHFLPDMVYQMVLYSVNHEQSSEKILVQISERNTKTESEMKVVENRPSCVRLIYGRSDKPVCYKYQPIYHHHSQSNHSLVIIWIQAAMSSSQ